MSDISPSEHTAEQRFLGYARDKDAHGLNLLLLEHVDRCYAQARRITGRDHLAEEAVQEACLKLILTADRYDGGVPFGAWLAQLVANAAIDQLRRSRRHDRHRSGALVDVPDRVAASAEDDRLELLRTALDELPERFRRPLVIHFIAGLDHEQTAKALGVAPGTVASRISRGKERLRARLARIDAVAGVATLAEFVVAQTPAAPATLAPSLAPALAQGFTQHAATGFTVALAAHPVAAAALALAALTAVALPLARANRAAPVRATPVAAIAPVVVRVEIGEDLQAAIDAHGPGTRFVLAAGVHRLQSATPKDADVFTGEPGAAMSGARELTGFRAQDGHWCIDGQTQQGQLNGVAEDGWPGAVFPEDLFVDDAPLRHVRALADLAPGRWYFDYDADRIWLGDDPTGRRVETSVARCAFRGPAANVVIADLRIEKYAIPAQMGAIGDQYAPAGWSIRNCDVCLNHGTGINLSDRWTVVGCRIHDNGQKGLGGSGRDLRVEGCDITANNFAHYSTGWEAGGAMFHDVVGMTVRDNRVLANHGCGLLFQTEVLDARIEGNAVIGNDSEGIAILASARATVARNQVRRNANYASNWLWGSQILLRDSADCEIAGNTVEVAADRGNAIGLIQQDCGSGPRGPYRSVRNRVHDNEVIFRGGAGGAGCIADFDQAALAAGGNVFDANHYHAPDLAAARWWWNSTACTWTGLRALGQEAHGSFDSIMTP